MSSNNSLEEGDVMLCTVMRIENSGVFVALDEYGVEAAIIMAEVAPGRIRNIREFVSVGKKIVCKVLRKEGDRLEMSLRRVSAKERDSILDRYKKERICISMLRPILGAETEKTVTIIKKEKDIAEFTDNLKSNPESIKKYVTLEQFNKVKEMLIAKKEKEKEVHKKIALKTNSSTGISDIKSVLEYPGLDIAYLGSSQFLVRVKGTEYKLANSKLDKALLEIKERAKKLHIEFIEK